MNAHVAKFHNTLLHFFLGRYRLQAHYFNQESSNIPRIYFDQRVFYQRQYSDIIIYCNLTDYTNNNYYQIVYF